ncbi:MAG: transporter, partial [Acidimicrobiales bacterium]
MNRGTLIGSVIFAVAVLVAISFLIQLMLRGWRHRVQRQVALIGALPAIPDTVGAPIVGPTRGMYVGCTMTSSWLDRIAVGDLGYRTKAVLTRYPEGIMVQR